MAARIAAIVLALYALYYAAFLVLGLVVVGSGAPSMLSFAVLLLPAGAAIWAAFRIGRVLQGQHRRIHLLPAALLMIAVVFFAAALDGQLGWAIRNMSSKDHVLEVLDMLGRTVMPSVLSLWIAIILAWSGIRAFRRVAQ